MMSAAGREASGPRTYGTMQYEQKLVQPAMICTHAQGPGDPHPGQIGAPASGRLLEGPTGRPLGPMRSEQPGQLVQALRTHQHVHEREVAEEPSRRLWARHPATTTSLAGVLPLQPRRRPRWPASRVSAFSRMEQVL